MAVADFSKALIDKEIRQYKWLVLLLICLTTGHASENQSCQQCHRQSSTASSVHKVLNCIHCHPSAKHIPHPEDVKRGSTERNAVCAQCHAQAASAHKSSVHAGLTECQDCHGKAHAILSKTHLNAPTSPQRQTETCGQCHGFPPDLLKGYLGSVHGKALFGAGLITAPACSDCHNSHGVLAAAHSASRTHPANLPQTCGKCHVYILDAWVSGSIHGLRWQQGKDGPVCTSCHKSHKIDSPHSESARLKCPEICAGCHEDRFLSYRVTFHGQATDLGFKTAANCSDCHTPHGALPAKHPQSSVHLDNLSITCGRCHEKMPEGFFSFRIHFDVNDPDQSVAVYFTGLLMSTLLISVFGFFAVHDLLWLQRSLVGVLRGEFTPRTEKCVKKRYLRRFSTADIGLHITLILSFLVLAATGLMLKFHFAAWAGILVQMLGGLSVTRVLHRLAALITFAYVFFHLFSLFKQAVWERDYAIFWGWRSMVPRGKDWRDLIHHLRYFLYLGPRPAFDRWTYWEKFDYFAVFWGVAIMGASGLMLWFPGFFTHIVPGWALNIAQLVHSEEALLAVGFVLVFHLFHSHLRPESFPMDATIFTGTMTVQRFRAERPTQYQRLLNSGELQALYTSPPTRSRLLFAYIFGFTSVIVGALLIVAILWAVLVY